MKTLIAIPCREMGRTDFWKDFILLRRVGEAKFGTVQGTLLHDTRNSFAGEAIREGYDRVLWIDDDMRFTPDLMERMMADMDSGMEYVSALAFKRVYPTSPVIYSAFTPIPEAPGLYRPEPMMDYPPDSVFEIAASGFGCVMTSTALLKRVWDEYGPPFAYHANLGEDLSFCLRVKQMGIPMYCDSRIKVGHIGTVVFDEKLYQDQRREKNHDKG